jgi:hypothetical protein
MFEGLKNSDPKRKDVRTSPPHFGHSTLRLLSIPIWAFKISTLFKILVISKAGSLLIKPSNLTESNLVPSTVSITLDNKVNNSKLI